MTLETTFRAAQALNKDWLEATSQIIVGLGDLDTEHTLGFLYVGIPYAPFLNEIAGILRKRTGVPHWVGAVGMGVCGAEHEYFDVPAMSVLVAPFEECSFKIFHEVQLDSIRNIGVTAKLYNQVLPPLVVVHANSHCEELPQLIEALNTESGGFLVGGLSVSDGNYGHFANEVVSKGLSGVMLSSTRNPVVTGLTQGCSPIGPIFTVTEAEQNILITLNDQPAYDVFCTAIGEELVQNIQKTASLIFVALLVDGSDTGDYLVRNLVAADPRSGCLAIGEYVEVGRRVMFCRRDQANAEKDLRRMTRGLNRRIEGPIKGGLYFSCVARGPNQFGSGSKELGIIAEELGKFPLAGFFGNGEISHNRLYSYTGVLTLFI